MRPGGASHGRACSSRHTDDRGAADPPDEATSQACEHVPGSISTDPAKYTARARTCDSAVTPVACDKCHKSQVSRIGSPRGSDPGRLRLPRRARRTVPPSVVEEDAASAGPGASSTVAVDAEPVDDALRPGEVHAAGQRRDGPRRGRGTGSCGGRRCHSPRRPRVRSRSPAGGRGAPVRARRRPGRAPAFRRASRPAAVPRSRATAGHRLGPRRRRRADRAPSP